MALTEKVIWTVCPAEVKDGRQHLSIIVSPRLSGLTGDPTLIQAPKAWQNWPEALSKGALSLVVHTANSVDVTVLAKDVKIESVSNSTVYAALFDVETTPLYDHAFLDLRKKTLLSYPASRIAQSIEAMYTELAKTTSDDLPSHSTYRQMKWPGLVEGRGFADPSNLMRGIRMHGISAAAKGYMLPDLFDLVSLYHQPLQASREVVEAADADGHREQVNYKGYKPVHPPVTGDALHRKIDFHRIVSALGNHPRLARACGLVIDVSVELAAVSSSSVKIRAQFDRKDGGPAGRDRFPFTVCAHDGAGVVAAPQDPARFSGGFLVLGAKGPLDVSLQQLDIDGAALKLRQLASTMSTSQPVAQNDDDFDASDDGVGAHSLRTAGLMLVQDDRADEVSKKADRSGTLNDSLTGSTTIPDLYAEDLIRGYRIDIAELHTAAAVTWRSLCRRIVTYNFLSPKGKSLTSLTPSGKTLPGDLIPTTVTGLTFKEEGTISLALGSTADTSDPSVNDVYKVPEGIFVWRGWSLCAPEPAKSLKNNPKTLPPGTPMDIQEAEMVRPSEGDPGPGMPLKTTFSVEPGTLPRLRFGSTYTVRLRTVDLAGHSVDVSTPSPGGVSPTGSTYLRYEPVESPAVTLVGHSVSSDKTLVAEVSPQWGESMTRVAVRSYNTGANDATTPDGTRNNVPPKDTAARMLAAPRVTQRFAEQHGSLDDGAGRPDRNIYHMLHDRDNAFDTVMLPVIETMDGYKNDPVTYMAAAPNQIVPYLPDPMAEAVLVQMMTLGSKRFDQWVRVPIYASSEAWPNSRVIVIKGDPTATALTVNGNTVTVPMPQACRQRIRVSSILRKDWLDRMALYAKTTGSRSPKITSDMADGKHWMLSPWREMEFIHATQKPLVTPQVSALERIRKPLDLTATVRVATSLNAASTGRLDLQAEWGEPDDNPMNVDAKSGPSEVRFHQTVVQQPIARKAPNGYALDAAHHFPDTRCRKVAYNFDAISRFREFFRVEIRDDPNRLTVSGHARETWIPSSARPPAPSIAYVIPTFGWLHLSKVDSSATSASKRIGGLRVYLNRPWLETGYNEMLAVVLPQPAVGATTVVAGHNDPHITQWGRDPATSGYISDSSPRVGAFSLAKWKGPIAFPGTNLPATGGTGLPDFVTQNLTLPDLDGLYQVAPHQVGYDPVRQLWYADITVVPDANAYYPFLRLSVARYQPVSVDNDTRLSKPVTCDFFQIAPNRLAILIPDTTDSHVFELYLYGALPDIASFDAGLVDLKIQFLDPGLDDVLGWRDAGDLVVLASGDAHNAPSSPTSQGAKGMASMLDAMPVGGETLPDWAAHDRTPHLIKYVKFRTTAGHPLSSRRLLITESEGYYHYEVTKATSGRDQHRVIYAEAIAF